MWQQLNLLAKRGPVHVFTVGQNATKLKTMPLAASWEHVETSTHQSRFWPGLAKLARVLFPPQYFGVGDFADRAINARLRRFINRTNPELVVLSHWNSAMPQPLRARTRPFTVIFDSHNIEWRLESDRRRALGKNHASMIERLRAWGYRRQERLLFEHADRSLVVSPEDLKALATLAPSAAHDATVWPNAVDLARYATASAASAAQHAGIARQWPTLIFSGLMSYEPNEAAAIVLITRILPRVRERYPNARLLIVGKDPWPSIAAAANHDPGILVTGTVADVLPYLAVADVAVVPLQIGGGSRLKILEALAARIPVVSTSKGAEGIVSSAVLVEDNIDAMADRVIDLLNDPIRRERQTEAGYELAKTHYSWTALEDRDNLKPVTHARSTQPMNFNRIAGLFTTPFHLTYALLCFLTMPIHVADADEMAEHEQLFGTR